MTGDPRVIVTAKGRYHRAVISRGQTFTSESCNLDDAIGVKVLFELPADVNPADLCRRCFADAYVSPLRGSAPEDGEGFIGEPV